ncbi:hypothetical protein LWI29_030577 [Acer saccharum]|uniref:C-JID domain-containing protein n=1 Tax=Acer saccharum TaxID=4024 RepID=A0AA39W2U2_ACESA|nr:hypothetical protein LWI29_030577 [Acer saccharum]
MEITILRISHLIDGGYGAIKQISHLFSKADCCPNPLSLAKQIVDEASIFNEADCCVKPSSQTEMEERGRSSREERLFVEEQILVVYIYIFGLIGYGVDGDLMMGTKYVEGIMFNEHEQRIIRLDGKSFSRMINLRLLKIGNVDLSEDLEYLSNELRYLKWHGYPSNSLPSNFHPRKLFALDLCHSRIKYLWKGMETFERLKTIKLSYSHNLIETPDFTRVPNLEMLDLEGCTRLHKVHDSIGLLQRLITLNLKGCKNLVSFPSNVSCLKLLKILNLQGCSKLDRLPQNLGELEVLEELDAGETAIRQVPPSIARLSNLESLSFCGCKVQSWWSLFLPRKYLNSMCLSLPPLLGLFRLKTLDLSDCGLSDGSLPSDLGVEDCISLEDVSNALRGGTSPNFALHLFNCLKLHENLGQENNLAIMLLKQYLQQQVNLSSQFHIRLPGFDIPAWFSCKNDGNSVEIGLPPNWLNDDFMGIAMCGVFEPALENLDCIVGMGCIMSIMRNRYHFYFKIPSFTAVESHHLWLAYTSRVKFEYHTSHQLSLNSDPSYKRPDDKAYGSDRVWVGGSTCIHAVFQIAYKKSTGDGDNDNDDGRDGDGDSDGDVDNGDSDDDTDDGRDGDGDDDNDDGDGEGDGSGNDDNNDGDGDGDDKKCKVIKCGIRLVYKQDKNYFQESSAAEGSVFHQKDNCSTGCPLSGSRLFMPTTLEEHCNIRRDYSGCGLDVPNLASDSDEE